jgi:hypothetical protein
MLEARSLGSECYRAVKLAKSTTHEQRPWSSRCNGSRLSLIDAEFFELKPVWACLLVGLHLLYGALQVALLFRLPAPAADSGCEGAGRWACWGCWASASRSPRHRAGTGGRPAGRNHISFVDIFLINALLPSAFVAKSEVARWPLIGWLARRNGTVFIERGNRKAAQHAREHMLPPWASRPAAGDLPRGHHDGGRSSSCRFTAHCSRRDRRRRAGACPGAELSPGFDGVRSEAPAYIDDISADRLPARHSCEPAASSPGCTAPPASPHRCPTAAISRTMPTRPIATALAHHSRSME